LFFLFSFSRHIRFLFDESAGRSKKNDPDATLILELTKEELESFELPDVPINFRSLSNSIVMPSFDSSDGEEKMEEITEASTTLTTETSPEIKRRSPVTEREKKLHAKGLGNFK
jgi:hypothetical protein